ncbi:MAG: hypothetical protein AAF623_03870 [Planctomycetota bacterium]
MFATTTVVAIVLGIAIRLNLRVWGWWIFGMVSTYAVLVLLVFIPQIWKSANDLRSTLSRLNERRAEMEQDAENRRKNHKA